jgi:putative DNA primase/helicase
MTKRSEIPNDVAALAQAHFVPTVETARDKAFAENLVKQLTGDDTVTARVLYREFFNFRPSFKIWIATNYQPTIRGTDHAIWERMRLIPFTVTIPAHERDTQLRQKLMAEAPGILAWAVRGCLAWQHEGLKEPDAVRKAIGAYRREMDPVYGFLKARCLTEVGTETPFTELYNAYCAWCTANGKAVISRHEFATLLTEHGYVSNRSGHDNTTVKVGLRLRHERRDATPVSESPSKILTLRKKA